MSSPTTIVSKITADSMAFYTIKVSASLGTFKGGFPVMAEITRMLAANIRGQFFFVITTTARTLLGSKFSTNLLFAANKCHATIHRQ